MILWAQIALAAFVAVAALRTRRRLDAWTGASTRAYGRAALRALAARNDAALDALREPFRASWSVSLLDIAHEHREEGELLGAMLDERMSEIRYQASRVGAELRIAASLASALGLLGAIAQGLRLFDGLSMNEVASAMQRVTFEAMIVHCVLGVVTMLLAIAFRRRLRARARHAYDRAKTFAAELNAWADEGQAALEGSESGP